MPVISQEAYDHFLKCDHERPRLLAQLATARQEGINEGLEMAARYFDGKLSSYLRLHAADIRALKTPVGGGADV